MFVTSETAPLIAERDTRPWLSEDWLSLAIGLAIFAAVGFVIWVGLINSRLFFSGVKPPLAS